MEKDVTLPISFFFFCNWLQRKYFFFSLSYPSVNPLVESSVNSPWGRLAPSAVHFVALPCLLLTWLLPVTNSVTSIRYFQLYSFSICSGPSNNLCAALWHISNFVVGEKDGGLHILSSAYACTICTVTVASAKDSKIMLLFSLSPAFSLLLPGCGCAEGIQL